MGLRHSGILVHSSELSICLVALARIASPAKQLEVLHVVATACCVRTPKLKTRWNLHLWGDEDWISRHGQDLPPVPGERFEAADWLPRHAYFTFHLTLVLV